MNKSKRKRHVRRENPPGMVLQARDIDVIEAVHRFRILSQAQIAALFFGSRATAQYRLEKLYDHHFLDRRFLPVVLGQGRSPTLYILDRRGMELLRTERGYDELKWFGTSKDLKPEFLSHSLAINDVMVMIINACLANGFVLEQWQTENEVKADYDRVIVATSSGRRERMPVVPDSYFTILAYERRYPFFLELDRGTMTLGRFKDKVRAYLTYYKSGAYEKRYGSSAVRLLTVVASATSVGGKKRLANLKKATEELTTENWFWFASLFDLNSANNLSQPVWLQANREEPRILITPPSSA